MSEPVYLHVARSEHRGSILRYGLRAQSLFEHAICRYSGQPVRLPRQQLWKIPGQPVALYVTCDPAEARRYAEHLTDRFGVRRQLDLWQISGELELARDEDWPGDAWHTVQDVSPQRLTLQAVHDAGGGWRDAVSADVDDCPLPDPVITRAAGERAPGDRVVSSGAQPLEVLRVEDAGRDTLTVVFAVERLYPRAQVEELACPLKRTAPVDVFVPAPAAVAAG